MKAHTRSDTQEGIVFKIEGFNLAIHVFRARSEDHTAATVHDISIVYRNGSMYESYPIPTEFSHEFIEALIEAHGKHKKWLEEGANWNIP